MFHAPENRLRLAYERQDGAAPGVIFLGGYGSDMTGTKATMLAARCADAGIAYLRFDYRGHGQSDGDFKDGCIGDWLADALAVFDDLTEGPQILVGSSMGGWLALLVAQRRPDRVKGIACVAAAPDFTEDLVWTPLPPERRARMERDGFLPATDSDFIYTHKLVTEGRAHLLLRAPVALACSLRLLQGQRDDAVPWETALRLAACVTTPDVQVTLVKDGDHRLNRAQDGRLLWRAVEDLRAIDSA